MNTVWLLVGLGVVGAIAAILRGRARGQATDLGFVSHQWVAEQRLSQQHDSQR